MLSYHSVRTENYYFQHLYIFKVVKHRCSSLRTDMGSISFYSTGTTALIANYGSRQVGAWGLQCPVETQLTQISEKWSCMNALTSTL